MATSSQSTSRLLKKGSECFEGLSMNGIANDIKTPPFVLSTVEGLRTEFFSNLLDKSLREDESHACNERELTGRN